VVEIGRRSIAAHVLSQVHTAAAHHHRHRHPPNRHPQGPPPPGVMNAELFARSPDNIKLLLTLLEDEPVGTEDFYCRCGGGGLWGGWLTCLKVSVVRLPRLQPQRAATHPQHPLPRPPHLKQVPLPSSAGCPPSSRTRACPVGSAVSAAGGGEAHGPARLRHGGAAQ